MQAAPRTGTVIAARLTATTSRAAPANRQNAMQVMEAGKHSGGRPTGASPDDTAPCRTTLVTTAASHTSTNRVPWGTKNTPPIAMPTKQGL
jgi:hypothetical protein